MEDFVHLHLHTEYSLLDGACRIDRLFERAIELGQTAVAITDHGSMYGAVTFFRAAKKAGIKPIIGCEVYVAERSRFDKDYALDKTNSHLVLLCKNETGYKNLIELVSRAYVDGFYSKPRIDLELLEEHHEGLVCLSACLAGRIPRYILAGEEGKARDYAKKLKSIFGEDFYLEIQNHGYPDQMRVNSALLVMSKELGIELVATNDVHYLDKSDAASHAVLLCIQTGNVISDGRPLGFDTDEYYLKSGDEMRSLFAAFPGALENTVKIAEKCCFEFDFSGSFLPKFELPENTTSASYLRSLCEDGLERRFDENKVPDEKRTEYRERLDYELSVIGNMGFSEYFLIVGDFVRYAKSRGIYVGPGRGSGAGSLAAYCLSITSIDPIEYGLLFERFLNPERVTMPDIDIDFCYERRHEVIDYVVKKYGEDHVAQIVTFNTMAARAVVRDVGRVLGMSYSDVDSVAKKIPRDLDITLERAMNEVPELMNMYNTNIEVKKLIDISKLLEGMPRHASIHAAGVVITDRPISEYVPLAVNSGSVVTQYTMNDIADIGLLKIDFLGLRFLTVIRDSVELVRRRTENFDIERIPENDPETMRMISSGETVGLFQIESGGMRNLMTLMKPRSIDDITTAIAIYRPGPMDSIPKYLKNRENPDAIEYAVPELSNILRVTDGCIIYQEQVMQIFRSLAGYSFGRADIVRRAMSKKKKDVMAAEKDVFINGLTDEDGKVVVEGCLRRGIPGEVAEKIFDEMAEFAKYAFNKSHAAAYSMITYRTGFLKCHFPCEYMAALLTSQLGGGKLAYYVGECIRLGITVLGPDINESDMGFSVKDGNIRFGLLAVKNVGEGFIKEIFSERENGLFTGFSDFVSRMSPRGLNKKMVESLILCGAFDSFGVFRSRLAAVCDKMIDDMASASRNNPAGQMDMFSAGSVRISDNLVRVPYPDIPEFNFSEMLKIEKDICGIYLSGHPLYEFSEYASSIGASEIERLPEMPDKSRVRVVASLSSKKIMNTKKGDRMAFVSAEDLTGSVEIIVFPKVLSDCLPVLEADTVLLIEGELSFKDDEPKIIASRIMKASDRPQPSIALPDSRRGRDNTDKIPNVPVRDMSISDNFSPNDKIYLRLEQKNDKLFNKILALAEIFDGSNEVIVFVASEGKTYRLSGGIAFDGFVENELFELLGRDNVKRVSRGNG